MSVQSDDARAKVIHCEILDDQQKAKMLLLINTEPDATLPVFTGVPDFLLGHTLSMFLERMTAVSQEQAHSSAWQDPATSETPPGLPRVLTAVLERLEGLKGLDERLEGLKGLDGRLEGLDGRLKTIELGLKLSTYQTKVRLRYSASRASNESRPDNKEFKLALIRAYQPQQQLKTTLFCMVTGVELPKENIVGGHIASHSKRTDMESLLLIKNIDDVRNGMLWSQPIENAYEDSRICFAFHPEDDEYRLHVLDSALLTLSLADPFPHHSRPKVPQHAIKFQTISWQDLDGKCIQFGASCTKPFRRAFTLHAYLAWDLQLDRQCLPDSFDVRDILTSQWSCEEVSGEVMRWLASTMPSALRSVAEGDSEEDDASGVSS